EPSHQHGAGPAIALRAAFLGAAQPPLQPQPVEQGRLRPHIGDGDLLAIEEKPNGVAGLRHRCPPPRPSPQGGGCKSSVWQHLATEWRSPPPLRGRPGGGFSQRARNSPPSTPPIRRVR